MKKKTKRSRDHNFCVACGAKNGKHTATCDSDDAIAARARRIKKKAVRATPEIAQEALAEIFPIAPLRVARAVRMVDTIRSELLKQNVGGLSDTTSEAVVAHYVNAATTLLVREQKPTKRELWEAEIAARASAQKSRAKEPTT